MWGVFVALYGDEYSDRELYDVAKMLRKELVLVDDPTTSAYLRRPKLLNGGGGLVGTGPDYVKFATMLANGGELDGHRVDELASAFDDDLGPVRVIGQGCGS